jgi:DivIVA domain-containing protein
MPLTPADVDNVEFRPPPAGTRGYDEVEVDAFLDVVAADMRRLIAENQMLSEQAGQDDLAELTERLQRLQESCARAEREARAVQAQLEQARATAGSPPPSPGIVGVLELAQRTADEHLAEAQQEAETLLRQANTKADQLTSDAELRASTMVADARHKHAERIAGIAEKRDTVIEEIAELSKFARTYRESLADLLHERLSELTGKPRPEKPAAARSA